MLFKLFVSEFYFIKAFFNLITYNNNFYNALKTARESHLSQKFKGNILWDLKASTIWKKIQ